MDECLYELDDCNDDAFCINTVGGYKCKCNSGYQGNAYNCSGNLITCITVKFDINEVLLLIFSKLEPT